MIINASSLNALFIGFRADFKAAFDGAPSHYERIATTIPSSTSENKYSWLGQTTRIREWVGERVIQNLKDYDYTITNKSFEATLAVKRDVIEDDQYGVYKPLFQELGRVARIDPDKNIFGLLRRGFDTPCYDKQYFFDNDHPVGEKHFSNLIVGNSAPWYLMVTTMALKPLIWQTRRPYEFVSKEDPKDDHVFMSNEYVYGVDGRFNAGFGLWQLAVACKGELNPANYQKARSMIMSYVNESGEPLGLMPDLLVAPPSLEGSVRRLLVNDRNSNGSTNEWAGSAEFLITPWLAEV